MIPENTEENRFRLAEYRVDDMDVSLLQQIVIDSLMRDYKERNVSGGLGQFP